MALQQDIKIPVGINLNFKYTDFKLCTKDIEETLTNAYIKIETLTGDKTNIKILVGFFTVKNGILVFEKQYTFIPNVTNTASNFIKQGYEYLKTLPEFTDAVDLLDEGQTI